MQVFCFSSIIALVVVMVFMAMVGGSVSKEEPKRSRLYRGSRQATNRGRKSTIPARFVPLGDKASSNVGDPIEFSHEAKRFSGWLT